METALRILRGDETPPTRTPGPQARSLTQRRDQGYGAMRPPALEYRLLALFRFWNAIEYFFPYKELIGRPWDVVLREYIPKLEAADDEARYVQTLAELVSTIEDTHGRIGGGLVETQLPRSTPPLSVTSIEGETVIAAILDETLRQSGGLQVGDVVRSVDGEGIEARRERIGRLVAASTPQARQWRIHQQILAGEYGSDVVIEVERADGTRHTATVRRTATPMLPPSNDPVYRVLPEGYGYIDLERLTRGEVDAALDAVRETSALIIDIRGYPQGTAFEIAPRLTDRTVINARFRIPEVHGPDPSQQSLTRFDQQVQPSSEWRYTGKVVVLINEEAISHAEHSCLLLDAATDVTFIGTPTNGANGNVTGALLPGGIGVIFTGLEVRHGDGRQLQRVGVQPDIHVAPTIDGIRAGRDEVLEAAVTFLQEQQNGR
jgi:C-terminal processing protease CtpA/Prc